MLGSDMIRQELDNITLVEVLKRDWGGGGKNGFRVSQEGFGLLVRDDVSLKQGGGFGNGEKQISEIFQKY